MIIELLEMPQEIQSLLAKVEPAEDFFIRGHVAGDAMVEFLIIQEAEASG